MTTTLTNNRISQFAQLLKDGIEAWVKAGEILVQFIDEDGGEVREIMETHPWITCDVLNKFERIGRKQLMPGLLIADTPGERRMIGLPYSQQEKYSIEPVELLVMVNGKPGTLNVPVKNLTAAQAAQVFSGQGVRTTAQQRAYMLDKETKTTFPKLETFAAYKITKGFVHFTERCTLNAKELSEILSRIS